MKIKSLYIDKLKTFKDFRIKLDGDTTAIIGENGLGKTTILNTIYDMVSQGCRIEDYKTINECSIEVVFEESEIKTLSTLSYREVNKEERITLTKDGFNEHINTIQCGSSRSHSGQLGWFNKVVYLPTDVNFQKYKVKTPKDIEENIEMGVILNSDNMSIDLKEYLVNIHYQDLEDISIGDKPFRIEKFKNLYNSFFEDKEFLGVKKFEPIFRIKETGEIHSADELSAGEKQIFFRGGSLLKMNLKNSIILIDEPELSLHPEWQQKILKFYQNIGENNQIIIATHSPHIISGCKKEEVVVLISEKGKTVVKDDVEETYGWTVEQLLLSVFQLDSIRNPEVQEKLDKFKALYINKPEINSKEMKEYTDLKNELEEYIDPEDPELSLVSVDESSKKLESILQKLRENKDA